MTSASHVFPIGTAVRVKEPDDFIREVAAKVRNRKGFVKSHQAWSDTPIVVFPKEGRRKEFVHHFKNYYLEKIDD